MIFYVFYVRNNVLFIDIVTVFKRFLRALQPDIFAFKRLKIIVKVKTIKKMRRLIDGKLDRVVLKTKYNFNIYELASNGI